MLHVNIPSPVLDIDNVRDITSPTLILPKLIDCGSKDIDDIDAEEDVGDDAGDVGEDVGEDVGGDVGEGEEIKNTNNSTPIIAIKAIKNICLFLFEGFFFSGFSLISSLSGRGSF